MLPANHATKKMKAPLSSRVKWYTHHQKISNEKKKIASAKKELSEIDSSLPSSSIKPEADYPNYHQYLGKIVLLQAIIRGHIIRKNYPRSLFFPKNHSPYKEGSTNQQIDPSITGSPDERYVENCKFPNGAIYTGITLLRLHEK